MCYDSLIKIASEIMYDIDKCAVCKHSKTQGCNSIVLDLGHLIVWNVTVWVEIEKAQCNVDIAVNLGIRRIGDLI